MFNHLWHLPQSDFHWMSVSLDPHGGRGRCNVDRPWGVINFGKEMGSDRINYRVQVSVLIVLIGMSANSVMGTSCSHCDLDLRFFR